MSLERLELTPLTGPVGDIITSRGTGTLLVSNGSQRTSLDWANGELALVRPADEGRSLGAWLFHKGLVDEPTGRRIAAFPAIDVVPLFHDLALFEPSQRNAYLREWTRALILPLFSLATGTAAFEDSEALDPDKRVFFQSPAPLVVDGIRAIASGLIIRNALGDVKRMVEPDADPWWPVEELPLAEREREIAYSVTSPRAVEDILRDAGADQLIAAKTVLMLTTLGTWGWTSAERVQTRQPAGDDPTADLQLLAKLASSDTRSLQAVNFARRLPDLDLYETLSMSNQAPSSLIADAAERLKREYVPADFPPVVQPAVTEIRDAIERARAILTHPAKRREYDALLARGQGNRQGLDQYVARRAIAMRNLETARELALRNDYYGAIVLLRQSVRFDPGNAEAWYLLGTCQEKNPKWRRDATVSLQKALAADSKYVDAMLALGNLYRLEGLPARARNFYADVLAIDPENTIAKARLAKLDAQK